MLNLGPPFDGESKVILEASEGTKNLGTLKGDRASYASAPTKKDIKGPDTKTRSTCPKPE